MTGEAWTIIVALATALQGVSIYLLQRVDHGNKELTEEVKENNKAVSAANILNAELAKQYIKMVSEKENN